MPDSMGKMIAMITALSEMQDRRRKLALEEDTLRTSKEQFAKQFGLAEKGQQQTAALRLIDIASKGGAESAVALQQLGGMFGLNPDEQQILGKFGPDATTAKQLFDLAQQKQGLESMGSLNPTPQQTAQQHAYLAQQANTNPGQMATGGLQARLANTPISRDLAQRAGEGFVMRQATGQDPFAFAVGQAGIDQGMAPAAAGIGAGITPSWMNQAQDQYWRAGLSQGDRQIDAQAQRSANGAGVDMGSYASLMNTATGISRAIAEGKYANENMRDILIDQYNRMAPLLGLQPITTKNKPAATGAVQQGVNKLRGAQVPGLAQPDTIRQTPTGSMYRPPNFF